MQLWMCKSTYNHSGGNGKRDPPVLIPNTEVKPLNAGSTWLDPAREIMKPPDINARLAQSVEHAAVNRSVVGSSPTTSATQTTVILIQSHRFLLLNL